MPLFKPGNRTYILSGLALLCALLLQAESQGVLHLAPLLKVTLTFALTAILPLVPVYIRKAIAQLNPPPQQGDTTTTATRRIRAGR